MHPEGPGQGGPGERHEVQPGQVQGPAAPRSGQLQTWTRAGGMKGQRVEKDSVDEKLNMTQQRCSPSTLVRPHLESCVQGSSGHEGPGGAGPEEAMKMTQELRHLCYDERLRELGLVSLEERRLQETSWWPFSF